MSVATRPDFFEEHAWMLGVAESWPSLSNLGRRQSETRIAAMLFKRRWRLLIYWRSQSLARPREDCGQIVSPVARKRATIAGEIAVLSNLPPRLPVLREEIAILRAFLAPEIDAILFGEAP
jgi:hypothetical protein